MQELDNYSKKKRGLKQSLIGYPGLRHEVTEKYLAKPGVKQTTQKSYLDMMKGVVSTIKLKHPFN